MPSVKTPTRVGAQNQRVGMTHWNGHLLCAIDTETTGVDPTKHEILEIAVIPANGELRIHDDFLPFHTWIKPDLFEASDARPPGLNDEKLANYKIHGVSSTRAADMFMAWFESLKLGNNKKIMPLGHNWPFDRDMIISWLGRANYEHVFHGFSRCTMQLANVMNDASEFHHFTPVPHAKLQLGSICAKYGVSLENAHTAMDDAKAALDLYAALMRVMQGRF